MEPKPSAKLLVVLSVCYGITVALLGALGSSAIGIVAIVGALVIGGLWALRSILSRG
jgi:hypothetical protein